MAITNITKTSGVIGINVAGSNTKYYFASWGNYQTNDNGQSFTILIQNVNSVYDTYQVALSDLRINGLTPTTYQDAETLLKIVLV
jgi:hypothetical protein